MGLDYSRIELQALLGEVERLRGQPKVSPNAVSGFALTLNPVTKGVDVAFGIENQSGLKSVTLLRNSSADPATAVVLQTWSAAESRYTWSDTDAKLQTFGEAFYWLKLEPLNITGQPVTIGPEAILLNPALNPPANAISISASHGAAKNGVVAVTVNVLPVTVGTFSVKVYVSGYQGNTGFVAVGQDASSPIQFNLDATGDTVTFKAIAVSSGGAEATSGPTCTLTLDGSLTVPAKMLQVLVTQVAGGNQLLAPASKDEGLTGYQVWRAQAGGGFGAATNLATVAAGNGAVQYLDSSGLANAWEYYLVAQNAAGSSPASDAATPFTVLSSAQIPPNAPINTTNTATVDSIDAGSNATVRIYGSGGVGTGYTRITGYGSPSRPAGTITGQPYATKLFIVYTGTAYLAFTLASSTLPDGWEFIGPVTTVAAGGTGGIAGGGGATGDGGQGPLLRTGH